MLGLDIGTVIWKPRGCDQCGHTGFKGRIGVFEVIKVDETVRRYIYAGGDEAMIAKHAFLKAPTLASAARAMVARGLTTPEEAIRVAPREDVDAGFSLCGDQLEGPRAHGPAARGDRRCRPRRPG